MAGGYANFGNSVKGMLTDGATEKAILYVYLVNLMDNISDEDNTALEREKEKFAGLEKDLMNGASSALGIGSAIKTGLKSLGGSIVDTFTPGSKSADKVGEAVRDQTFVKFKVQYNPTSIRLNTLSGRQERKVKETEGLDGLKGYTVMGKTRMSFDLVFDDCDNMDAFMLNEVANVNLTNAINKGLDVLQHWGSEHSVRQRMDAIMSLLSSMATQHVIFFWSGMMFRGQITDVSNRFTMFNKKGNPIRGEMHVEITQDSELKDTFGYKETYWKKSFDACFKKDSVLGDLAGAFSGNSTMSKLANNSIINISL